jgi:hypothetical protein
MLQTDALKSFTKIQDCFIMLCLWSLKMVSFGTFFSNPLPKVSGKMSEDNEMSGESEDVLGDDCTSEAKEGESGSSDDGIPDASALEGLEGRKVEDVGSDRKDISPLFSDFMRHFEEEATPEGKIRLSIDFMRTSLSNSGTPRFKDFWEGRRTCLPLFKKNISVKVRSQLWSLYVELSAEAKRLKEILDEQSAFAIEQIELAIQAVERDLEHYELTLSQTQAVSLPYESISLKNKAEVYNAIHKELLLLNTFAARVSAMRKEVVKTEMRIRIKNKLLGRLSLCGDKIFPKRKELIKKISQEFVSDVDEFIASHFQDEEFHKVPLYALREEIKQLQSLAKVLTLNTHAFTETRLKLSGCWDKIKNWEKERKKQAQHKRQTFKQHYDLVMEKIRPFAEACAAGISIDECHKLSSEILDFMRTVELGRDEVRALKDEIHKAKRGPLDRSREMEQERQRKEKEVESLRREKINALKNELNTLIAQAEGIEVEALIDKRDQIHQQFEEFVISKAEKQIVDRLFKQLKDMIDDKKERMLLMLSEDDLKALDQLKAALEERKQRRYEVKNQLEQYRKLLGGSGFDFEKAMMYREMIEAEKALIEKINSSIEEIEERIDEIEG